MKYLILFLLLIPFVNAIAVSPSQIVFNNVSEKNLFIINSKNVPVEYFVKSDLPGLNLEGKLEANSKETIKIVNNENKIGNYKIEVYEKGSNIAPGVLVNVIVKSNHKEFEKKLLIPGIAVIIALIAIFMIILR